jgi:hypothetical protein
MKKCNNIAVKTSCRIDNQESRRYRELHTRVRPLMSYMQTKQKVTLYLSPELHRRLKIRSAVDSEPMSELAERALVFYLANSELVEEVEASSYGRTHRVYSCPACDSSLVLRDGEMSALGNQPGVIGQEHLVINEMEEEKTPQMGEEELVPC